MTSTGTLKLVEILSIVVVKTFIVHAGKGILDCWNSTEKSLEKFSEIVKARPDLIAAWAVIAATKYNSGMKYL
jgi:hypothetical protein